MTFKNALFNNQQTVVTELYYEKKMPMILQYECLKVSTWVYGKYVNIRLLIYIVTATDNLSKLDNYYTYMGSAGGGDVNDRK